MNILEHDILDKSSNNIHANIQDLNVSNLKSTAPSQTISKKTKAAIIYCLMANHEMKLPLTKFSQTQQIEIAYQLTALKYINKETLTQIIQEFIQELEAIGLSFPDGIEGALNMLDGSISDDTLSKLRLSAGFEKELDPWQHISQADETKLLEILEKESIEVNAIAFSKISIAKAAALMGQLPGAKARQIAHTVSKTDNIKPEVVARIGMALTAQLREEKETVFENSASERVGAILNYSNAAKRDEILDGLQEEDSAFAADVRKNIFTFAHIPERIETKDIPKIIKNIEQDQLLTALAGAKGDDENTAEFIFANMSQRLADNLKEEMGELGNIKEKDAENAMTQVVIAIRELETSGEISLIKEEEE